MNTNKSIRMKKEKKNDEVTKMCSSVISIQAVRINGNPMMDLFCIEPREYWISNNVWNGDEFLIEISKIMDLY